MKKIELVYISLFIILQIILFIYELPLLFMVNIIILFITIFTIFDYGFEYIPKYFYGTFVILPFFIIITFIKYINESIKKA